MGRIIDSAGVMIIHGAEGCARRLPDGRYVAYADPGSGDEPWSIGWGSTGPDIHKGLIWTRAQADARFAEDLGRVSTSLERALGLSPTTDNQFSAMGSLAYNIGMHRFLGSSVYRFHQAGDQAEASQAFAAWDRASDRILPGLQRRRAAESALYLTPDGVAK